MIRRARLDALLAGCPFGRPLRIFESVGSTNDACKRMAEAGEPEGAVALAWRQTRGRGQFDRAWVSAPGEGLALSVLLRPALRPGDLDRVPVLAARAVAEALARAGVRSLRVEPPNDVLAGDRKIAGLLMEPRIGGGRVEFAVLGIGVNLKQGPGAWTGLALRRPATSCRMEGVELSIEDAAAAVLLALARRWPPPGRGRPPAPESGNGGAGRGDRDARGRRPGPARPAQRS